VTQLFHRREEGGKGNGGFKGAKGPMKRTPTGEGVPKVLRGKELGAKDHYTREVMEKTKAIQAEGLLYFAKRIKNEPKSI